MVIFFYDLGCGSGRIIKAVSDNFNIEAYGVEIAPIPFIKANILCIDNKNTHINIC
jgi:methylase of polypeptide subunit release factors